MGRVVHFEIHCGDLDRAERFYRDVFGWEIQRYEGAPVDYRLVTTGPDGEIGINGALVERRGEIEGQAVIAYVNTVAVEDLSATQERVAAAGGEVALDRHEVPGVGHLAYFKDTEGNLLGALQPTTA
jgi:uncharacterized protein